MTNHTEKHDFTERPASIEDAAWLWELYSTLLKPSITEQWGWDEASQYKNFSEHLPFSLFSILENNGDALAAYAVEEKNDRVYLHMLLVVSEHQSQGIGSHVMNLLKAQAEKLSLPIELSIFPANKVADFYVKNEFKLIDATNDKQVYRWSSIWLI